MLYISPVLCHSMREREGGRKREGGREGRRKGKGERDSGRERIDGLTMNTVIEIDAHVCSSDED